MRKPKLNDLKKMEELLFEKVWYARHASQLEKCNPSSLVGAKPAKDVEDLFKSLGRPLRASDDYDAALTLGALAGIRWVLGHALNEGVDPLDMKLMSNDGMMDT